MQRTTKMLKSKTLQYFGRASAPKLRDWRAGNVGNKQVKSKNWGNPLANKAVRPQKKILPPQRQYWQKCFNTFDYLQILTSFKIDAILQRMNIHRTRRCTSLTLKNYQLPFLLWHPAVKEVIKCKTGVEMGASLAQRDALWNLVGGFV